jgi:hypothetical protein
VAITDKLVDAASNPVDEPMMTTRRFTVSEVDALIPELERRLRRVGALRQWMRTRYARLERHGWAHGSVDVDIPDGVDASVRDDLEDLHLGVTQLREDVAGLLALGCVVRSLDGGLLDFRARHVDRDIYLCWKLGESRLSWWHELDEGFAARKVIDGLPRVTLGRDAAGCVKDAASEST